MSIAKVRPLLRPEKSDITVCLLQSLKSMISDGVLVPGSKLPPERQLAAGFGVSRSSLRQALKVLEIMGVLSQRVGDGTYLNTNAGKILSEPINLLVLLGGISHHELFEARFIVEPELAARAAERATADDIARLKRALIDLEASRTEGAVIEADLAFHAAIFIAAGNRVCQAMFSVIQRALITSISYNAKRDDVRRTLAFHQPIFDAIYKRDPEGARERMVEHLAEARALLQPGSGRPVEMSIIDRVKPVPRRGSRAPAR